MRDPTTPLNLTTTKNIDQIMREIRTLEWGQRSSASVRGGVLLSSSVHSADIKRYDEDGNELTTSSVDDTPWMKSSQIGARLGTAAGAEDARFHERIVDSKIHVRNTRIAPFCTWIARVTIC